MHSEVPPTLSTLLKQICCSEAGNHQIHLSIDSIHRYYPYQKSLASKLVNIFHPEFTSDADYTNKISSENTTSSSSPSCGIFTFVKDPHRLIIIYPHAEPFFLPPELNIPGSISFPITCAEYPALLTELQCQPGLLAAGSAVICFVNQPSYELMREFDSVIDFEYVIEGRNKKLTLSYASASTMPALNDSLFSIPSLQHLTK